MNSIALLRAHARLQFLDLVRYPGYVVPTVLFPSLFYVLFVLPYARSEAAIANETTLAFVAFAVVGVTLYQFGIGIAQERGRPWERYNRTLPVSAAVRFSARILAAALFGLLTAALVGVVARAFTPVDLTVLQWLRAAVYALLGGIPFVLMGITLGYWTSARAAVPVATALNLLLAYGGGLWMPPQELPHAVAAISPFLPTRQFADVLWSVATGAGIGDAIAGLTAYTALFAVLAALGYRRDERTRYA